MCCRGYRVMRGEKRTFFAFYVVCRFELRYAKVCLEMGKLNLGIKHLYDVIKHFEEMNEDQFDFHLYAFHQGTLRSFVQFLRMQNRLHAHKSVSPLSVNFFSLELMLYLTD